MITRKWVTRHSTEDDETFPLYLELSQKGTGGELITLGFVHVVEDNPSVYKAYVFDSERKMKETLCNSEAEGKEAVEEFCKEIPYILKDCG